MNLAVASIIVLLILGVILLMAGIYFMFWSKADPKDRSTEARLKDIISFNVPAQALLMVIGAGFLGFGAWLAVTVQSNSGHLPPDATPTASAPTASVSPIAKPSSKSPVIQITKPSNGSYVQLNDTVEIRISDTDMTRYVWLLVQLGSQVYPEGPCDNISPTVTSCPAVRFGDPGMPVGTKYLLTAVLVNAQGSSAYMPFIENGFVNTKPPVYPIASSPQTTVRGNE
jgi:hypothetical protein